MHDVPELNNFCKSTSMSMKIPTVTHNTFSSGTRAQIYGTMNHFPYTSHTFKLSVKTLLKIDAV